MQSKTGSESAAVAAPPASSVESVVVLDFGSQTAQLIARRVRERRVYCELLPHDVDPERALALRPSGIILSGGPASVYEPGAPQLPDWPAATPSGPPPCRNRR